MNKKSVAIFLFPVAYLGKVSLSFVQEKITQLFSSSPGTKTVLDCRVLCPAEQAGWGGCTSSVCSAEGCSGTLCHECSTLACLMNPWIIRFPSLHPAQEQWSCLGGIHGIIVLLEVIRGPVDGGLFFPVPSSPFSLGYVHKLEFNLTAQNKKETQETTAKFHSLM